VRPRLYPDRATAGRALAECIAGLPGLVDPVVLALPRGGVPVGWQVAHRLRAPLGVVGVRKLGLPWQPELAMGAVAVLGTAGDSAGHVVRNEDVLRHEGVDARTFDAVLAAEREALRVRALSYLGDQPAPRVSGRPAVLVDDGLATGATMRAAVEAVRGAGATRVVVAVPVGAAQPLAALRAHLEARGDAVVCPWVPRPFHAVGRAYVDFAQTGDDEVRRLLSTATS
jgi:putative phosphoribosyl transferase